jgi:tripartite-type tricarboxylate transporter receptor subunit TctC
MHPTAVIDTLKKRRHDPECAQSRSFDAFVREDVECWAQVVRAAGVKADSGSA